MDMILFDFLKPDDIVYYLEKIFCENHPEHEKFISNELFNPVGIFS